MHVLDLGRPGKVATVFIALPYAIGRGEDSSNTQRSAHPHTGVPAR